MAEIGNNISSDPVLTALTQTDSYHKLHCHAIRVLKEAFFTYLFHGELTILGRFVLKVCLLQLGK